MKLPVAISIPHAGLEIPQEVRHLNLLSPHDIAVDGDEGAAEIYCSLEPYVQHFFTTPIARAYIDLNRAEDDFRKDGVIKTHTCFDVPVYKDRIDAALIKQLLEKYYHPYHNTLSDLAGKNIKLGIDCHTMAEFGPPVGPDTDKKRPFICLGNDKNRTCNAQWIERFADCLSRYLPEPITFNDPFAGGWITRFHGREIPWLQLEMSRTKSISLEEKSKGVLKALTGFASEMGW